MSRPRSAALLGGLLVLLVAPVTRARAQTEHYDHVSDGFGRSMRGGGVLVVATLRLADRATGTGELQVQRVLRGKAATGPLRVDLVFEPLHGVKRAPAPGEGSWQVGQQGVWELGPGHGSARPKVLRLWSTLAQYPGMGIPAQLASMTRRDWSPAVDGLAAALLLFQEKHGTHLYFVLTLKNVGRKSRSGYLGADSELIAYGYDRIGQQVLRRFVGADFVRRARPPYPTLKPGDQLHLLVGFLDCATQSVVDWGDTVWAEFRTRARVRGVRPAGLVIPRTTVPWHEMRCPAVASGAPQPPPSPAPAPAPPAAPWPPPATPAAASDACADRGPAGQWQAIPPFPRAGQLAAYAGTLGQTDGRFVQWKASKLYVISVRTKAGHVWDPCTNVWSAATLKDFNAPYPLRNGAGLADTELAFTAPMLSTHVQDLAAGTVHLRGVKRQVPSAGAPAPRNHHVMATDGKRLLILGGRTAQGQPDATTGAWLDVATMTWHPLPAGGPLGLDVRLTAFWYLAGDHFVVAAPDPQFRRLKGHIFDFKRNQWSALSMQDAPLWDTQATALGSGGYLIVMSAHTGIAHHGAILDLAQNRWRAVGKTAVPLATPGIGGHELAPGRILLVKNAFVGKSWVAVADLRAGTVTDLGTAALALRSNATLSIIYTGKRVLLWGGGIAVQTGSVGKTGCENPPPGVGCDPIAPRPVYSFTPSYDGYWLRL